MMQQKPISKKIEDSVTIKKYSPLFQRKGRPNSLKVQTKFLKRQILAGEEDDIFFLLLRKLIKLGGGNASICAP